MAGRSNSISQSVSGHRVCSAWLLNPLTLIALSALSIPDPCQASPIRSQRLHATAYHTEASLGPAWTRFLSGGPALWAVVKPPRFPSNFVLASQNGLIVDTPFVNYLNWRRNLNPARFDLHHPTFGPELARLLLPALIVVPTTVVSTPTNPQPLTNPVPENAVPEPSTLAIGLTVLAFSIALRHRRILGASCSPVEPVL